MKKTIAIIMMIVFVGVCAGGCNKPPTDTPADTKWNIGESGLPECLEWGDASQITNTETFSYESWDTNTVLVHGVTLTAVVEYMELCKAMGFEGQDIPRGYLNGVCAWMGACDNEHHADMQISIIHWKIDQHKSDAVYNLKIMFRYHT